MKLVVDTNIVFSTILNSQSRLGQILISGSKHFEFYTVSLLAEEITAHRTRIMKLSGLNEADFELTLRFIFRRLIFVDSVLLPQQTLIDAMKLTADVDENDTLFVALSMHLSANLWTGDKKLIEGIKAKGYDRVISSDELYAIYLKKQLAAQRRKKG